MGTTPRWGEKQVLGALRRVAAQHPRAGGGLIVFVDEMGKFLESAAYDGADIYFFQQLAEIASRSNGRLIVVGILHQAFEEYAHRLSREARDEWSKIQGRFVDLAVNTRGDEQIDLLGRAIESDRRPATPSRVAQGVAAMARAYTSRRLPQMLEECWPLHPIVACLLGPVSRRRFGQNQRSIFGFLNSAEPQGLQDFLREATMATSTRLTCCGSTCRPISNLPSWLLPTATGGPWPWTFWSGAGPWAAMRSSSGCSRRSRWWGCFASAPA